jgi:hypothetical protein
MERVEGSDGLPQNHFTHFEFVRLASPSEGQVVDEHLTAPVALVATSAKQLKVCVDSFSVRGRLYF